MRDFDIIYTEYFFRVYKFTLVLCKSSELAEEITQQTFFKALKNINDFNEKCNIGTWLCTIAKNTYFDYLKKHRNVSSYFEFTSLNNYIEEQFFDKETAMEIHKILHKLKEPYKEVFWQRTFGELSFSQIGILFDKSENWARVTYYRAKIMIKEKLE